MSSSPSNENTRGPGNEISLIVLIKVLWSGKWQVGIACFLAVLLGLAFHFGFNKMITGQLNIEQLDQIEITDFQTLKELLNTNGMEAQTLLEMYQEHLISPENLIPFVEQQKLFDNIDENPNNRQQIVNLISKKIHCKLVKPGLHQTFQAYIHVEIKDDDPNRIRDIVKSLLHRTTGLLRATALNNIGVIINNLEEKRAFEIEKTNLKIEAATDRYFKEKAFKIDSLSDQISTLRKAYSKQKQDTIHQLSEQAIIAQSLGIEKPLTISYDQIPEKAIITQINSQSQPVYFRGYLALEKEIELIKNREQDDSFIPGLRDLETELLELTNRRREQACFPELLNLQEKLFILENDPTIVKAKKIVDERIRDNPDLHFVSWNINRISFSKLSLVKVLVAALLAGFSIGVLWVLINAAVRYQN